MDESNRRVQRMQIIGEEEEDDGEAGPSRINPDSTPRRRSNPVEAFRRVLRINRNPRINRHRSEDGLISAPRDPNDEDSNDDNEATPENAEKFDTELPAEHSYLGNMMRVSGLGYLEENSTYRLLVFVHHSLVFPGETLPMIIPDHLFDPTLFMDDALLFGVVFPSIWNATKPKIYGVTCKVYEKRSDEHGNIIVKSRVHQRFVITEECNKNFTELLESHQSRKVYARVKILPEILLPDPLSAIDLGSMNRFRHINSMENKLRNIQAGTTIWPKFVFDKYRLSSIVERTKRYLFNYKIESMPTDYTLLSFWFGRNLIFNPADRTKLFITNSVNIRMQIIEDSLDYDRYFCCRRCRNQIANCNTLFAMSKHGVQTNYCNPGGIIHETNTVYAVRTDAVYPSGAPSTQFSWFPGYSWQVLLCRICDIHIGWRFDSTKPNLIPQNFYALSGLNIIVDLNTEGEPSNYNSESGGDSMHEDYVLVYDPLDDD